MEFMTAQLQLSHAPSNNYASSEAHLVLRSGKVGTQNGVQVQLADIFEDDGAPRFTGTALGELLVSSPALFLGYWGEQEATEKVLERDTDGIVWYMAGDVAQFDPETV